MKGAALKKAIGERNARLLAAAEDHVAGVAVGHALRRAMPRRWRVGSAHVPGHVCHA